MTQVIQNVSDTAMRLWVKIANVLASRGRRERMHRFVAYVLLIPS